MPSLRSSTTPKRPPMLPHAPRSTLLIALALTAACGGDGPLGPTGGQFTPGQSLAVESGRLAYRAGRMGKRRYADPSSPLAGLI